MIKKISSVKGFDIYQDDDGRYIILGKSSKNDMGPFNTMEEAQRAIEFNRQFSAFNNDEYPEEVYTKGEAKDAEEQWITVKGTHVKIGEGESKGSAVKKFINSKKGDTAKSSKKAGTTGESQAAPKKQLSSSQKEVAKYLEEESELSSPEDIKEATGSEAPDSYKNSYNNALNFPVGSKAYVDGKSVEVEDYISDDEGDVVYATLSNGDMVDASELKSTNEGAPQKKTKGSKFEASPEDKEKQASSLKKLNILSPDEINQDPEKKIPGTNYTYGNMNSDKYKKDYEAALSLKEGDSLRANYGYGEQDYKITNFFDDYAGRGLFVELNNGNVTVRASRFFNDLKKSKKKESSDAEKKPFLKMAEIMEDARTKFDDLMSEFDYNSLRRPSEDDDATNKLNPRKQIGKVPGKVEDEAINYTPEQLKRVSSSTLQYIINNPNKYTKETLAMAKKLSKDSDPRVAEAHRIIELCGGVM